MSEIWTPEKIAEAYKQLPIIPSRDYAKTIAPRIEALAAQDRFAVEKYGEVTYVRENGETGQIETVTHELSVVLVGDMDPNKETFVIVGGTHGYEKGGPLAALGFAEEEAADYADQYNIIIYPCVAPGAYEIEEREVMDGAVDPNRDAHLEGAKSQEMRALARSVQKLHKRLYGNDTARKFAAAVDLHETPKKDIAINDRNAERGLEKFELEPFPEGMFMLGFEKDKASLDRIIEHVRSEGHQIVSDETIYGSPNRGGLLLAKDLNVPPSGPRVRNLMSSFAVVSITTELCGREIDDAMPDKTRAEPQRAVIRGMLTHCKAA